ncbi:sensor domain-containing protein [Mycolicibacterium houstonense]|uniref:sensor domain-containing protein n=1 Tax=Mycolicibacterium houstonense TaxID=146021 RepID=UPI00082E8FD7|nr:sensor domain-containing protein [Mycolicibacterium houstonense]MCV7064603.1 sensor domain-containing protein [Mycolicibacterium farcinogenes]
MRFVTTTITIAAVCALGAGCGNSTEQAAETTSAKPMITSFPPEPLRQKTLPRLLLTPEQINAAMAAKGMEVTATDSRMSDDSATMSPRECLAVDGAAQAPVYADSGFTDEQEMSLREPDAFLHYAKQAVVRFADAQQAKAFFDSSVRQWPECKQYTHTQSGTLWQVGPISVKDGVLSTIATQSNAQAGGWACGRALSANNNVVIDVNTCSANPADSAVNIVKQISARVDAPPIGA